jgi:hypothetical protein
MHDQFLCVLRLLFALTSVISTRSLHARDGITQDSENAAILQPPTTSIAELAPATTAYKLRFVNHRISLLQALQSVLCGRRAVFSNSGMSLEQPGVGEAKRADRL